MRCLQCGKAIPLLKRLGGSSEFCSEAHRREYQDEFSQLALGRLLQSQPPELQQKPAPTLSRTTLPVVEEPPTTAVNRGHSGNGVPIPQSSPAWAEGPRTAITLPAPEEQTNRVPKSEPQPEIVAQEPDRAPQREEPEPPAAKSAIVEKPAPAVPRFALLPVLEFEHAFAALTVGKPRCRPETLLAELPRGRALSLERSIEIAKSIVRAIEHKLDLREMTRPAPRVTLDLRIVAPDSLEIECKPLAMPLSHAAPVEASLWIGSHCGFVGELGSLSDFADAQFSQSDFEPAVLAGGPGGNTSAPAMFVGGPGIAAYQPVLVGRPHAGTFEPRVVAGGQRAGTFEPTMAVSSAAPLMAGPWPVASQPASVVPAGQAGDSRATTFEPTVVVSSPAPLVAEPWPAASRSVSVVPAGHAGNSRATTFEPVVAASSAAPVVAQAQPAPSQPVVVGRVAHTGNQPELTFQPPVVATSAAPTIAHPQSAAFYPATVETQASLAAYQTTAPLPRVRIPDPELHPIAVNAAGIAPGKAKPLPVFGPVAISAGAVQIPKPTGLPLRPVMVLAKATGPATKVNSEVSLQAALSITPEIQQATTAAALSSGATLGLPELRTDASPGLMSSRTNQILAAVAGVVVLGAGTFFFAGKHSDSGSKTPAPAAAVGEPNGQWLTNFAPDAKRQRRVSLLRSSMNLSAYRLDFESSIRMKALGWVYRAQDPKNFYVSKIEFQKPGVNPVYVLVHYAVIDGVEQARVETPLQVSVPMGGLYQVRFEAVGNRFTTWVQGQQVEQWTDPRLTRGGAGLYGEGSEQAILRGEFVVTPLSN